MAIRQGKLDRQSRGHAAALLEDYLAGHLTAGKLFVRWPESNDAAVTAIATELLPRLGAETLADEFDEQRQSQARQIVERCILFLRTDSRYIYGDIAGGGFIFALLVAISLAGGLSLAALAFEASKVTVMLVAIPLALCVACLYNIVRSNKRKLEALTTADMASWPFENPAALAAAKVERQEAP